MRATTAAGLPMVRASPPPLGLAATELPRAITEMGALAMMQPLLSQIPQGDGHAVMVLPGFTADDTSTRVLRRFLRSKGYDVHPWGLGRNLGPSSMGDVADRLALRLELMKERSGRKVSLVGWSLGGIYARELARAEPDLVRQVISLGSPFGGHPSATNVWRLFQMIAGENIDIEELEDEQRLMALPVDGVPATAIYSKADGVASWRICKELPTDQTDNIEVNASHLGLGFNPFVFYAIADRLGLAENDWAPFDRDITGWRKLAYPSSGHDAAH
ncbi:MAG: lipase family alpha/beta hydrolase [Alphaproteobacteria bacterium]